MNYTLKVSYMGKTKERILNADDPDNIVTFLETAEGLGKCDGSQFVNCADAFEMFDPREWEYGQATEKYVGPWRRLLGSNDDIIKYCNELCQRAGLPNLVVGVEYDETFLADGVNAEQIQALDNAEWEIIKNLNG